MLVMYKNGESVKQSLLPPDGVENTCKLIA